MPLAGNAAWALAAALLRAEWTCLEQRCPLLDSVAEASPGVADRVPTDAAVVVGLRAPPALGARSGPSAGQGGSGRSWPPGRWSTRALPPRKCSIAAVWDTRQL